MEKTIEISTKTLLTLLVVIGIVWLLVQIGSVIISVFFALIIAFGLSPLVDYLGRYKLSRPLAVFLTYLVFLSILIGLFTVALSPMITETQQMLERFPTIATAISLPGAEDTQRQFINTLAQEISSASGNFLIVTVGVFSNALAVVATLVLTFYFLVDFPVLKLRLLDLFSRKSRPLVEKTLGEIEHKIGGWLRGQLLMMVLIGVSSFVGLTLIGVSYALPLALIAGLLEIIPTIGPLLSIIPAVIVGAAISPLTAVLVALLYLLIQQLENQLIVPQVMKRVVGLSPLVTLIVILIGGKLLGVVGAFLAIPVTLMIYIIFKNLYRQTSA